MSAFNTGGVPAVDGAVLAVSAACVFDLPEHVSALERRAAISRLLSAFTMACAGQCHTLAAAVDARLEAFCCTVRSPLVRAWLGTDTSFVEEAFQIAAFAPVVETEGSFQFDDRVFFSLLLSRVPSVGTA